MKLKINGCHVFPSEGQVRDGRCKKQRQGVAKEEGEGRFFFFLEDLIEKLGRRY